MKIIFTGSIQRLKQVILSLFIFLFLFTAKSSPAQQQGIPSDGKDFYIGFVYPSFNKNPGQQGRDFHGFFGVYALISSYEDNNIVRIAYFDASGNETVSQTKMIGARNAVQVALDQSSMRLTEPGDMPEYRACHITSKKPVNVQYFSTGGNSGGSYLALPTPGLGKSYVIASYNDNPGDGANLPEQKEKAGGYFLVIAAFDSTMVTITPNGLTAGEHKSLKTYTVNLRRGQCYWVKGDGSNPANDMSGSIVTSDKPVAVLAGHEDAFLGGVNSLLVDARNFMIQQMIPAEYFDSTGYISMPLKDAAGTQPGDPGYGENYRVNTIDSEGAAVQMSDCTATNSDMSVAKFSTPEKNTGCPAEFHSTDGHKFGVMMYDLRSQGVTAPQTAEAMMTIVPMSHWRTSFLFYVPANTFEVLQNYYINVIALKNDIERGNIKYSFNGSSILSPLSGLAGLGSYKQIPYHPELEGVRKIISPGAYYLTNTRDPIKDPDTTSLAARVADSAILHGAFMVYHYGMRAIDPDRDLGDFCGDDFFFEYATPVGMMLGSGGGKPMAKVDTICATWHICVKDTGGIGIRSVTLLDDPNGNYYRPGKKYFNIRFDPSLDPDDKKEIDFTGKDTAVCFDVLVNNPLDSAYAPVYIVDSRGTHIVLDLRYQAPRMQISTDNILSNHKDSLLFPLTKIGSEVCSTIFYINTGTGKPFTVNNIFLKKHDGYFTIASISPKLPIRLEGGDTLKVQVCFDPKDTLAANDSVILQTDCFTSRSPVNGKGGTPLIYATDIDFGSVIVGTKLCKTLSVENHGTLPFILSKNWLLHDSNTFSINPNSAKLLPVTLLPGGSIQLTFCYVPTQSIDGDSTTIDWNTNIDPPFTNQIKSKSLLFGRPVKPGVIWDRQSEYFIPDTTAGVDSMVQRVHLLNKNSAITLVDSVFIIGATKSEFYILEDQLGYKPLVNFQVDIGGSIWIDVVFKPNLTKPYPERFADRIDSLAVSYLNSVTNTDSSEYLKLIGTWNKNSVKSAPESSSYTIRPNPTSKGRTITVSFANPADSKVHFSIFDVLGREVYHNGSLASRILSAGLHESEIPLPNLENGTYYARLTIGNVVATEKLDIIKY